eukprot:scaffold80862_cov64-Phaeocystis_antarctica.AAC.4
MLTHCLDLLADLLNRLATLGARENLAVLAAPQRGQRIEHGIRCELEPEPPLSICRALHHRA